MSRVECIFYAVRFCIANSLRLLRRIVDLNYSIWLTIGAHGGKMIGMELKEKIYNVLTERQGIACSGEELAKEFGVSRSAVWKAVRALRADGYQIDAGTNRGYLLSEKNDVLSAADIQKNLKFPCSIRVEKRVGSTNDVVKEMAANGADEWTCVIAEEQTAGRGRYARSFYSPRGSGIYMSVLLRPKFSAEQTLYITTSAAVAVCEAIESVCNERCEIKWVNDVFMRGKKVCGILTESSYSVENGGVSYAVVGIGINVLSAAFPKVLTNVATSVFCDSQYPFGVRAKLAAELLERFHYYYEGIPQRTFFSEYERRSFLIGKEVETFIGEKRETVRVLGVTENCFLRVLCENGKEKTLSAGEVSIRV